MAINLCRNHDYEQIAVSLGYYYGLAKAYNLARPICPSLLDNPYVIIRMIGSDEANFRAGESYSAIFNNLRAFSNDPWLAPIFSKADMIAANTSTEILRNLGQVFEKMERNEEAALIYELGHMFEDAGRVRRKARRLDVKSTSVGIDLNTLLDRLRSGGFAIPFRCASCGASLTIDSNSDSQSLKTCKYCGSAINTDAIINVIKTALG